MVTEKEPIIYLYDILKSTEIPIYKEVFQEDIDSTPESYILIRSGITDNTRKYGDGKSLIRNSSCDVILISQGAASNSDDIHFINLKIIKQKFKDLNIKYSGFNLGYDSESVVTQYTFNIEVLYYG